jgi:KDO2-lipid IV(A) lauroyltransferase
MKAKSRNGPGHDKAMPAGSISGWQRIRFLAEYALVRLAWLVLAKVPPRVADVLGQGMGWLAYLLDFPHRRLAWANLQLALGGERSEREIRNLARSSFLHLAAAFVDLCRSQRLLREPLANIIQFEGLERAERIRAQGRGMILITGHLGSWELGALASPLIGYPLQVVYRPLDNPYLDRWLVGMRCSTGNRAVPKRNALRPILSSLQGGEIVVVMMDLNTVRGEGVFVDFFGRPACTTYAPALLALRTGAAVLPILTLRQPDHRLKVVVGEEIAVSRSGDLQRDLVENTARFTKVLEGYIRAYPEQWFWPHERWKTKPKARLLASKR